MIRDVLFALRVLCGRPGLFGVAAASLGLGIGINVAVFSVAYGALLRPLPYRAPERLAVLWHHFGQTGQGLPAVHPLDRRDYGERSRLFEDLALVGGFEGVLGAESGAELVRVGLVTRRSPARSTAAGARSESGWRSAPRLE